VNSLTVGRDAVVNLTNSGGRTGFDSFLDNAGLLQITNGTRVLAKNTSGNTGYLINPGTIQAIGDTAKLTLSATINNAGGLIRVANSGTLDFAGAHSVTGGALTIEADSSMIYDNVQTVGSGAPFVFNNVDFTNHGYVSFNSVNAGHRKYFTISGGAFLNTGTADFIPSGSNAGTGNITRDTQFNITGANIGVNSGLINIHNLGGETPGATGGGSFNEMSTFTVSLSGGGSFTNTGTISVHNATSGIAQAGYKQYAAMTVTDGNTFTNLGAIKVSLSAASTDDIQHYATLLISTDWTNAGVITVDGANKTNAKASLDLTGKIYSQTGADAVTRLINGGQLKAASVNLNGGALTGSGEVLAATTLADAAILNFTLGGEHDSWLNVSGELTLDGVLNITDGGNFRAGTYELITYRGSLTDSGLTLNPLPANFDATLDLTTSGKVLLTVTSIPEPSTWLLLGVGVTLLVTQRRRQRQN
jgi:hypothetical protein